MHVLNKVNRIATSEVLNGISITCGFESGRILEKINRNS